MLRSMTAAVLAFAVVASIGSAAHARTNSGLYSVVTHYCGDRVCPVAPAVKVAKVRHAKPFKRIAKAEPAKPIETAEPEISFRAGVASVAAAAEQYAGKTPTVAELKAWARELGLGTWRHGLRVYCALGVNKVLAEVGMKGTGSALAASFQHWGSRTFNPQAGDVAVVGGHHVAVVVGRSAGAVEVVSFNDSGHRILRRTYPLRGVQYRTASL